MFYLVNLKNSCRTYPFVQDYSDDYGAGESVTHSVPEMETEVPPMDFEYEGAGQQVTTYEGEPGVWEWWEIGSLVAVIVVAVTVLVCALK